ncbi:hypothetical protein FKP32DRAFT_1681022 [Trametes sanguinea]|nr:hypothetical protein FKP32DRAFT_1681022 [Trametes sanguinea]
MEYHSINGTRTYLLFTTFDPTTGPSPPAVPGDANQNANNNGIANAQPANNQGQAAPADENDENAPPPPGPSQQARRRLPRVRDLRERATAIREQRRSAAPYQPRARRVLGNMNGQQVKDTRYVSLGDVDGTTGPTATPEDRPHNDYIDISQPLETLVKDRLNFPGSWTEHEED